MRVLLMIQRLLEGGGTETHVLTLARELKELGHHVELLTSGGPWVGVARRQGIPTHVYDAYGKPAPVHVRRLAEILRSRRIGIVHVHDAIGLASALPASRFVRPRPKLIYSVHGPYVVPKRLAWGGRAAHAVITVSPPLRARAVASGVPAHKIHVIQNGVLTQIFRPVARPALRNRLKLTKQTFVIGYASRFTLDKVMLSRKIAQALRNYANTHPNVHILIAGRGSRRHLNSGPRFHVLGHVGRMEDFYNNCNVVLGTGRVAMEAVSCGIPTVVIGKAGWRGLVTSENLRGMVQSNFGDHGALRSWSFPRLARTIAQVQRHRSVVKSDTMRARKRVSVQCSSRRMAQRVAAVYLS